MLASLVLLAAAASTEARLARPRLNPAAALAGSLVQLGDAFVGEEAIGPGLQGYSVAVSTDGTTALVGAPKDNGNAGAVWVFTRAGEGWKQQGPKLIGEGVAGSEKCGERTGEEEVEPCDFGVSIALSADGNTALVGSPRDAGPCHRARECNAQGSAWVYVRSGSTWTLQARLMGGEEETPSGRFGRGVALSADGSTAIVGAPRDGFGRGAAWVFTRSGSTWSQQGPKIAGASDESGEARFGANIALSGEGSTALIAGPGDAAGVGAAWIFERSGSSWTQTGSKLRGTEEVGVAHFGSRVAISADGSTALAGARADNSGVGAAWVFTRSGASWTQQGGKLTAGPAEIGNARFGAGVALSADGSQALIGAPHDNGSRGAAFLFTRSGNSWASSPQKLTASAEQSRAWLGLSVSLSGSGTMALLGAPRENHKEGATWSYLGTAPPPPPPRPHVTSVHPGSGPTGGGTHVTIKGSGFHAGAAVTIGHAAKSISVISETELTAETSATPEGSYEVVVSDEDGTSEAGPLFTYVPESQTIVQTTLSNGTPQSGGRTPPTGGVLGSQTVVVPPPVYGVSGNLTPLSGVVLVKLPGSKVWIPLSSTRQVPFGTIIDARHGKVKLTTVDRHGHLQTIIYYEGEFEITQSRSTGVVIATLVGGNYRLCPTRRERAHIARAFISRTSRRHIVRKLWSEGHGSYSTKGNYAAGAVLGTRWLTEDRCDGTLIHVSTDKVRITDFRRHRHVTVKAGHSYLAKAP
jgi:hypothetical protein